MKKLLKIMINNFDKMIVRTNKWEYIPESSFNMLYIVPQKYKGKKITLNDGTDINYDDMIGEIHIDNIKVEHIRNDLGSIFLILDSELNTLAEASMKYESFKSIKAYFGRTVLHPMLKKHGFTIIEMDKTLSRFFIRIWENILRIVIKKGKVRKKNYFKVAKECWISGKQILESYYIQKGKADEKTSV